MCILERFHSRDYLYTFKIIFYLYKIFNKQNSCSSFSFFVLPRTMLLIIDRIMPSQMLFLITEVARTGHRVRSLPDIRIPPHLFEG
jgi:hypothetical protein